MLKRLRQLLLGDRRTDRWACRPSARGASPGRSSEAGGVGARAGQPARQGGGRKPGFPTRGLSGVLALELSSSTPPSRTRVPGLRFRGLAGDAASPSPARSRLLAEPGDPRPHPHCSAAPPPDFLSILARALETPRRPKCTQLCVASGEGMLLLGTCTAPLTLFPRGALPWANSLRAL